MRGVRDLNWTDGVKVGIGVALLYIGNRGREESVTGVGRSVQHTAPGA